MLRKALTISGLLIAATLYIAFAAESEREPALKPLSGLPEEIGAWKEASSSDFDSEIIKVLGVDDYVNRIYLNAAGEKAGLYIGYYLSQRQGASIHSPLNCLPGSGWNPVTNGRLSLPVSLENPIHQDKPRIRTLHTNRITIQKGEDKQVVFYWYQSHGRTIASEYQAKIYTVLDAIMTRRTDAALVRIICPVDGSEETAEKNATDFALNIYPLLNQYFPN